MAGRRGFPGPSFLTMPLDGLWRLSARPTTAAALASLLALALAVMIAYFLVYIAYAAGLLRFPFDYDQGEGFELVDTVMLSEGRWPYRDAEV
ncbi:MAG: hypothetical protein QME94_17510, partial [Anaerolineae bacterium]|nr:hypothetical protein [Anaerolineae bacterium]